MTPCDELWVRVNDELVLDAGTCEEVSGPRGPERLIRSPQTTLSQQVLAYLHAKPDPPRRPSGSMVGREGVAATALALRWGSYLAVLLDRDKPVWPEVRSASTSRISDEEMARINIEASAALATWIDLYREDPGGRLGGSTRSSWIEPSTTCRCRRRRRSSRSPSSQPSPTRR